MNDTPIHRVLEVIKRNNAKDINNNKCDNLHMADVVLIASHLIPQTIPWTATIIIPFFQMKKMRY